MNKKKNPIKKELNTDKRETPRITPRDRNIIKTLIDKNIEDHYIISYICTMHSIDLIEAKELISLIKKDTK